MSKVQKIKTHLKENKKTYISCGITFVVTAAGVLFLSNASNGSSDVIQKITQIGFRNEANPVIVNLVERSTPSKPVHLVGTNLVFDSINDAARKTGHSVTQISKNVRGLIPNVGDDIFELLERVS
jgi:predicted PurR-regulated permease PerM